jgi:hypothetical protein
MSTVGADLTFHFEIVVPEGEDYAEVFTRFANNLHYVFLHTEIAIHSQALITADLVDV